MRRIEAYDCPSPPDALKRMLGLSKRGTKMARLTTQDWMCDTSDLEVTLSCNKNNVISKTWAGWVKSQIPDRLVYLYNAKSSESSTYHCVWIMESICVELLIRVNVTGINVFFPVVHSRVFIVVAVCTKRYQATGVSPSSKVWGQKCVTMWITPVQSTAIS